MTPDPSPSSSSTQNDEEKEGRCSCLDGAICNMGCAVWDRMKIGYQLCDFGSLPDYLRDNEYILRHYRANWPLKQTLMSIFRIHNETGNIWTHLIGFAIFLALTIYTARKLPTVVELPHLHLPASLLNVTGSLHASLVNASDSLHAHLPHVELPNFGPIKDAWRHMEFPKLVAAFHALPHVELVRLRSSLYEAMPHVPNVHEVHSMLLAAWRSKMRDIEGLRLHSLQDLLPHVELPRLQQIQEALLWYYGCLHRSASSAFDSAQFSPAPSLWPDDAMFGNCTLSEKADFIIGPFYGTPITRWPFFFFLGGAMLCLLSSTTCHLLSCHSKEVSQIIWRFDYAGIATLICASFYPPIYYAFLCEPLVRNAYLAAITLVGLATIAVSLLPVFQTKKYRTFRAALFFGIGVSGVLPLAHMLALHYDDPVVVKTAFYELLMGALYGLGAVFYATRIPERWLPGKFDIAGHSHQIFHVLVVAGAYTHYYAACLLLQWRDGRPC